MKQIKFLQSISGYGSPDRNIEGRFSFQPGDVVEIEDGIATAWTESGVAEFIKQVPVEPAVAEYAVKPVPENATKKNTSKPKDVVEPTSVEATKEG